MKYSDKKKLLTSDRLKEVLRYDPETGLFYWKIRKGTKSAGAVAGSINNKGYVLIAIDYEDYTGHRLAWLYMTGGFPKEEIDHENRVRSDNRFCNLREANRSTNLHNIPLKRNSGSGVRGVHRRKENGRYRATITKDGRDIHLGHFDSADEAGKAYDLAAKQLFGGFCGDLNEDTHR